MQLHCFHCIVSGNVQGVWFRANTQKEASKLGLGGWVRNLADGNVEVYACGDRVALEQLKTWLRTGPPLARVENIEYLDAELVSYASFEVG